MVPRLCCDSAINTLKQKLHDLPANSLCCNLLLQRCSCLPSSATCRPCLVGLRGWSKTSTSRATRRTFRPTHNANRIEIDSQFVDVSKIAGADRVRVQSDAARIDDPGEPGRLIDNDLHCSSARKRTTE